MGSVERKRILVSGRVQGVGFRWSTQRAVRSLDVKGWVRNLPDGRVEIVAEGPEHALRSLVDWCHTGPATASVHDVNVVAWPQDEPLSEFTVR